MEKLMFYPLSHKCYIGIVTILDYEIRLNNYLSQLSFPLTDNRREVIVDLALKSGINQYRFVKFDVDEQGKIVLNSCVKVSTGIENLANEFLRKRREIVSNSILPDTKKKELMGVV